jgi:AcrR family transcriptional regulator
LEASVPRERDQQREEAILRAALELLAEIGYDQLTMDAVAARARCSKATIYRRWPGKAELVITAVRRQAAAPPAAPDTGALRTDLLEAVAAMRLSLVNQDAARIIGLMAAMRRDPALAEVVRVQLIASKREVFGAVIARAVTRGDLPATADHELLAEISSALLLSRLLVSGEPLDPPFEQHLVDAVLMPVLQHEYQ